MQIVNILFIVGFCRATLADNSCIFQHSTKGVINLKSIGLRNGQPRFRDLSTPSAPYYTYSFNPCYPFTENGCDDAAVCQLSSDRQYSYKLGTQNISTWSLDANMAPVLTYTYGSKTVSITMICSAIDQDEFEISGEYAVDQYSMRLRSRCACWNGCISPQPSTTTSRTSSPPLPKTTTAHSIYYDACKYHDSRYGTIDLSSIGSITGRAIFKDVKSIYTDSFVWSYNPCYNFSEHQCHHVAGCQTDKNRRISYSIGLQDYAYWINMDNTRNPFRSIVYPSPSNNRRLTVQLICDQSISFHRLQVIGETSSHEYTMQLTSPCACWDGCSQPTPSPSSFTWDFWMTVCAAGIVLFLLFLIMISCLFCSKPKRTYHNMSINESTPIIHGSKEYRP
ncbi:unnamed protein product [Rotaria socialis]|uniref:MRH domain-containing protein n=1 Tax=Rotaria socialis TaxID=392032 RepID=A0A820RBT1_9BILA|nr:unnamed protein product [Rotaria socialis]CAF3340324.1 unnamed protein product [Rotaria socialis]CAF3479303.1 unnamed protein product [Rotaria socialis]CAF4433893.1 unnamed protein product [Rotaria socialis]CAF4502952.1 unnamed protein product [Rotaria socialis]